MPPEPAACPGCGALSSRVHGYDERTLADVPVGGRRVLVMVRVRRPRCPTRGCRQTFREPLAGITRRYQRRASRPAAQIGLVVRELAGRASARLLTALAVPMSWHTAVRCLPSSPAPARR
jgi:transposase